jgi:site-specific DNA recombinase
MAAVSACYTKTSSGKPKGVAISGKRTSYPLSGVLYCGVCEAPMIISGGSSRRYYNCGDAKKRGTCKNKLALREDIAKDRILGALRDRFG